MRFGHEIPEWALGKSFGFSMRFLTGLMCIHCIESPGITGLLLGKVHSNMGKW